MHQNKRETPGANCFWLPIAVAQHAAAIGRVHLNRFGNRVKRKPRPGKIVPYNRLQMPVAEAPARLKRMQTRQNGSCVAQLCIFIGLRGHQDSAIRPTGLMFPPAARADWGG